MTAKKPMSIRQLRRAIRLALDHPDFAQLENGKWNLRSNVESWGWVQLPNGKWGPTAKVLPFHDPRSDQ